MVLESGTKQKPEHEYKCACMCVCVMVDVIDSGIKTSKILLQYVEHVCYIRDDFPETNERLLNWQEN